MPMSITKGIKNDVNFVEKGIISDIQILKIKNIFAYNFTFPICCFALSNCSLSIDIIFIVGLPF